MDFLSDSLLIKKNNHLLAHDWVCASTRNFLCFRFKHDFFFTLSIFFCHSLSWSKNDLAIFYPKIKLVHQCVEFIIAQFLFSHSSSHIIDNYFKIEIYSIHSLAKKRLSITQVEKFPYKIIIFFNYKTQLMSFTSSITSCTTNKTIEVRLKLAETRKPVVGWWSWSVTTDERVWASEWE